MKRPNQTFFSNQLADRRNVMVCIKLGIDGIRYPLSVSIDS